jgi:hypothetical protein
MTHAIHIGEHGWLLREKCDQRKIKRAIAPNAMAPKFQLVSGCLAMSLGYFTSSTFAPPVLVPAAT